MATFEKVGSGYRVCVGNDAHHAIYRMMPRGWEPGADDEVVEPGASSAPVAPMRTVGDPAELAETDKD